MLVPVLDWPADLFTDATEPGRKTTVRPATMPTLWNDMVTSWVGRDGSPPRPVSSPESWELRRGPAGLQAGIRTFNSVIPWIRLE